MNTSAWADLILITPPWDWVIWSKREDVWIIYSSLNHGFVFFFFSPEFYHFRLSLQVPIKQLWDEWIMLNACPGFALSFTGVAEVLGVMQSRNTTLNTRLSWVNETPSAHWLFSLPWQHCLAAQAVPACPWWLPRQGRDPAQIISSTIYEQLLRRTWESVSQHRSHFWLLLICSIVKSSTNLLLYFS